MNSRAIGLSLTLAFLTSASILAAASSASAHVGLKQTDAPPSTSTSILASESCVSQVKAIATSQGFDPTPYLARCEITVSTTTDVSQVAGSSLTQRQSVPPSLSAKAAAGTIRYQDWSQEYWGGSVWEKHTGRTYWDGARAWVSSYRGFGGSHTCHATGSWSVGAAITVLSCSRPSAGASATSQERFQTDWLLKGVGVSYTAEIDSRYTATGAYSAWQVGG
jgi:hypothetical protein